MSEIDEQHLNDGMAHIAARLHEATEENARLRQQVEAARGKPDASLQQRASQAAAILLTGLGQKEAWNREKIAAELIEFAQVENAALQKRVEGLEETARKQRALEARLQGEINQLEQRLAAQPVAVEQPASAQEGGE